MAYFPTFLLWNVGSVIHKSNELLGTLVKNNIHVALVTETWLRPSNYFSITGYRVVRMDRSGGRKGDGVAILIHHSLDFVGMPTAMAPGMEAVFVRLKHPALSIGVVYSPSDVYIDQNILNSLARTKPPYIIGGDYNARHTSWNNYSNNRSGRAIFDHAQSNSYRVIYPDNFTFDPTSQGQRPSTLDIFLVNHQKAFECKTTEDIASQHHPVILKPIEDALHPPDWKRIVDWEAYAVYTGNLELRCSFRSRDEVDSSIRNLTSYLKACLRKASSFEPPQTKNKWLVDDPNLKAAIQLRRRFRKSLPRTGLPYYRNLIKLLTKEIDQRIRGIRCKDWENRLTSIKTPDHTFWQTYKILTGTKTAYPPLNHEGHVLSGDQAKADAFAEAFAAVHDGVRSMWSPHEEEVDNNSLLRWLMKLF